MEPTAHYSNNTVMRSPDNMKGCQDIPATVGPVNGYPAVVTFWQPTAEELADLNRGVPVALVVYGASMPPVWVAMAAEAPLAQMN